MCCEDTRRLFQNNYKNVSGAGARWLCGERLCGQAGMDPTAAGCVIALHSGRVVLRGCEFGDRELLLFQKDSWLSPLGDVTV